MIVLGENMRVRYIESLGHCGAANHSDLLFLFGSLERTQNKVYILLCAGLVSNDTVVVQVADDGQVQKALPCFDIRNIRYPLLIRPICVEIPV